MEKITTEEVMDKLDMFQSRSGKSTNLDGWTYKAFQQMQDCNLPQWSSKKNIKTHGIHLMLAAPEHKEINGQVEVKWRTECTIAHSLMVHTRVSEAYIHFA